MQKTKYFYVVRTKSKEIKNILLLSSMSVRPSTTKDDGKCKPVLLIFKAYGDVLNKDTVQTMHGQRFFLHA